MTIDNLHTWPVGPIPIAIFLYGIVQIFRMLIGHLKVDEMVFLPCLAVGGGPVVACAWLLGYSRHSDFELWKLLVVVAVGVVSIALAAFITMRDSAYTIEWLNRLKKTSTSKRVGGIALIIILFVLFVAGFGLVETFVDFNRPCTRNCLTGPLLFGDKRSALSFVWFVGLFLAMASLAIIVNFWALWRFRSR